MFEIKFIISVKAKLKIVTTGLFKGLIKNLNLIAGVHLSLEYYVQIDSAIT